MRVADDADDTNGGIAVDIVSQLVDLGGSYTAMAIELNKVWA